MKTITAKVAKRVTLTVAVMKAAAALMRTKGFRLVTALASLKTTAAAA